VVIAWLAAECIGDVLIATIFGVLILSIFRTHPYKCLFIQVTHLCVYIFICMITVFFKKKNSFVYNQGKFSVVVSKNYLPMVRRHLTRQGWKAPTSL
jgi:hypothetical protein